MIDLLWKIEPHYMRLVQVGSDKKPPRPAAKRITNCGVKSARWIEYDSDQIFEVLPEALTAIHGKDPCGAVVIEADTDPALRHAYPYDHRIFIMPKPQAIEDVFRAPPRAAEELQRVLEDTTLFASEVFGLFSHQGQDEVEPPEKRSDLTDTQMRGFLYSPLGDELATRIQLQQPYHALVESDVIVVNTNAGNTGCETAECLRRIERMLERVRGISGRCGRLFLCDPRNPDTRAGRKLLKTLKPMCRESK
jgi:hypothetical protein